jgi:hypothetical protein
MSRTTLETIEALLHGALDDTTDPEVEYKIRTALQFLSVVEADDAKVQESLESLDIDAETRESLRDLGYLE